MVVDLKTAASPLSDRGLDEICDFIQVYIDEFGYSPTVREIGAAMEIQSTATVFKYLNRLQEKGRLKWQPKKARTIHLMDL